MKAITFMYWLVGGMCGATLLVGCADSAKRPATDGSVALPAAAAWGYTVPASCSCAVCTDQGWQRLNRLPPAGVQPCATCATCTNGCSNVPVPAATPAPPMMACQVCAKARLSWSEATAANPAPAPVARIEAPEPRPVGALLPPTTGQGVSAEKSAAFPRAEPEPTRKSFVDPTAAPCFAHAPDYSWITGQVEYSRIAKEWRLRYASVDDIDQYGGRVVLIENHHVSLLHDGQYIRARGYLVNPDSAAEGQPNYRIESFEGLQNPNETGTAPAPAPIHLPPPS